METSRHAQDILREWIGLASAHIGGIETSSGGDDICALGSVLCCDNGTETGFFGAKDYRTAMWARSERVVPVTDCSGSMVRVIVSFAGSIARTNLAQVPAPPELISKLDLTGCRGVAPTESAHQRSTTRRQGPGPHLHQLELTCSRQ